MADLLPTLRWTPIGLYDCPACLGESRRLKTDCPECGGTGWHPPTREPDNACDDCGRPLWLGGRGPQWFEKTDSVRCRFCLLQASKGRTTVPGSTMRVHSDRNIDLAAFVDGGSEIPNPKPERTES